MWCYRTHSLPSRFQYGTKAPLCHIATVATRYSNPRGPLAHEL